MPARRISGSACATIATARSSRPREPQKKIEELYAQRDPLYREVADLVVDTGKQSVQTLVKDLLARLDGTCNLSA